MGAKIWLEGAGGNSGATTRLYENVVDFILCINDRRYRIHSDSDNSLRISCINGKTLSIGVDDGNPTVIISSTDKCTDGDYYESLYQDKLASYQDMILEAKNRNCCYDTDGTNDCPFVFRTLHLCEAGVGIAPEQIYSKSKPDNCPFK